jgi:hypothetical protein
MRVDNNCSHLLSTHVDANTISKNQNPHMWMRIVILGNAVIHKNVVLDLVSLRPLSYVRLFSLSSQSHTSLHLHFSFLALVIKSQLFYKTMTLYN